MFADDYRSPTAAFVRCATKDTFCSFKSCSFLACGQSTGCPPEKHVLVGSATGATATLEDTKTLPGNASLMLYNSNSDNIQDRFYANTPLPVISAAGVTVSETQGLDEIGSRTAGKFISVDDEWFRSLQQVHRAHTSISCARSNSDHAAHSNDACLW